MAALKKKREAEKNVVQGILGCKGSSLLPMSFEPSVMRAYGLCLISITSLFLKCGATALFIIHGGLILAHLYSCAVDESLKHSSMSCPRWSVTAILWFGSITAIFNFAFLVYKTQLHWFYILNNFNIVKNYLPSNLEFIETHMVSYFDFLIVLIC